MKFSELELHNEVLAGTEAAGFTECMPVQEKVLPVTLTGNDVMVQSKTGSGKTAVFVLTFLEMWLRYRDEGYQCKCLIVAPTRELAQQIADDAQILCSKVDDFRIACLYGGVGYENQRKQLKNGVDMYVGTPGRLIDFIQSRELDASLIDTFVIDEADRLFDMGFYPDIQKIFRKLCDKTQRQTMLFSATLEQRVRQLAWEFMDDPYEIELEPDSITVDRIDQQLYHVAKADKFQLLLQILKAEDPAAALIFTNLRHMTMELAQRLKMNGYNADFLSGDLTQAARQKALDRMKDGKTKILVATDVAARGLQIDDLPLVVNYDIPEDYENYVHRIGRTARAGKSGKAITLADEEFVYGLESIEKYIKMKIPVVWADFEPVEDLSLGKRWGASSSRSDRKPKASRSSKPSTKETSKNSSRSSSKPARSKGVDSKNRPAEKPVRKKEITPSKPLGKMTEKERMEFYKKKYGFEPVSKPVEASKPSKAERTGVKDSAVNTSTVKTSEKKGLVARIIGFFKGSKNA